TLALVGLDGLQVSGTVSFQVNTNSGPKPVLNPAGTEPDITIPGNSFTFGVANAHFTVADVIDIGGSVSITREPNGTLDVAVSNASVAVTVDHRQAFAIGGNATFTIGAADGFKLQSFKVNGFSIFGTEVLHAGGAAGAPVLFPTAQLADSLTGLASGDAPI